MSAPVSVYPVHRPTEVGSQLTFCLDNVALQLSIQLFPCNDSAARAKSSLSLSFSAFGARVGFGHLWEKKNKTDRDELLFKEIHGYPKIGDLCG